jgi:hypothetical protein
MFTNKTTQSITPRPTAPPAQNNSIALLETAYYATVYFAGTWRLNFRQNVFALTKKCLYTYMYPDRDLKK